MRPASTEVAPKIAAILRKPEGGAGCCLHVQISDGNLHDLFFEDASGVQHADCLELFCLLKQMKQTARRKACDLARERI